MYLDRTLSLTQALLIYLRLTEQIQSSWWLVMLPTIIWAVVGVIVTATGREEK